MAFEEIKTTRFWRSVFSELFLSWIFLFCGAAMSLNPPEWLTPLAVGFNVGFGVATFAFCGWEVSGGVMNPAITIPFLLTRKVQWLEGTVHLFAQITGGILASVTLDGVTPQSKRQELGLLRLQGDVTVGQGVAVEILTTMILVFTTYAVTDKGRGLTGYQPPLAIGLSITLSMLVGVQYTGGCLNPARQFGPAVVTNIWDDHWVYWVGPILGGVLGALAYDLIFATPQGRCLLKPKQNENNNLPAVERQGDYELDKLDDRASTIGAAI